MGGIVKTLDGSICLEVLVDLSFNLGKILVHILVSSLKLLLSELGNLAGHHALLILEEAIRSSKEAIKGHNFLKESKLRISLVLGLGGLLGLDGFLNGGVDLSVDLFS